MSEEETAPGVGQPPRVAVRDPPTLVHQKDVQLNGVLVQITSAASSIETPSRSEPVPANSAANSRMLRARRSAMSRHTSANSGSTGAAAYRTRSRGAIRPWTVRTAWAYTSSLRPASGSARMAVT